MVKQYTGTPWVIRSYVVAFVVVALALVMGAQAVFANETPIVCDFFAKYGCSYVVYNANNGGWLITGRRWRGGIDGGAKEWQIYWIKDWELVNGTWQFREKWGEGSWHTNVELGPWYQWANDDRARINETAVQFKFRYHEWTPEQGWYYWCSERQEHYLWNGTSARVGTGVCTG